MKSIGIVISEFDDTFQEDEAVKVENQASASDNQDVSKSSISHALENDNKEENKSEINVSTPENKKSINLPEGVSKVRILKMT